MGFLSDLFFGSKETKTTTNVKSFVFNIREKDGKVDSYFKTILISSALNNNTSLYLGESIITNHLTGIRKTQRDFFNWSLTNIPGLIPNVSKVNKKSIPVEIILPYLPTPAAGNTINVQQSFTELSNFRYFTLQYLFNNDLYTADLDWITDISNTNEITVEYIDSNENVITEIVPTNNLYDRNATYIIIVYSEDTEEVIDENTGEIITPGTQGALRMFIYKVGSGTVVLDNYISSLNFSDFYPVIPLRIDNISIDDNKYIDTLYPLCDKAIRKAYNSSASSFLQSLEDSPNIEEIDYAFLIQGVPLNINTKEGKEYIYTFFKTLADDVPYTDPGLDPFYFLSKTSNLDSSGISIDFSVTNVDLASYNISIHMNGVYSIHTVGLYTSGAKVNDINISYNSSYKTIIIKKQISDSFFDTVYIPELEHRNTIHVGVTETTTSEQAIDTADTSPFILPLHEPTLQQMSIFDSSELVNHSTYMLLNTYKTSTVTYRSGGFLGSILGMILITVIVVLSSGTGVGILGTHASVGASLGLAGSAAVIGGAVANAIVALVITQAITLASTAILGDQIGKIIGTVIGILTVHRLSKPTGDLTNINTFLDWSELTSATNLLKLTSTTVDAYADYFRKATIKTLNQIKTEERNYKKEFEEIGQLYKKLTYTGLYIHPNLLTSSSNITQESSDAFIKRTTMVGSDIVDLSQEMIYNYSNLNLSTNLT